ncbi:MAG TPA: Hsp20/alpha crystallin family protein [Prolixibacteraceae bacterium]|mgnify:CR=1 FL=1|nr:Hsp20/alpha crystallin family protein [Prolixibacteraceae bacterium]HPR60178.1 Hsp20/alpha crystallin family protein [Prolixibacteraceae bacterium]
MNLASINYPYYRFYRKPEAYTRSEVSTAAQKCKAPAVNIVENENNFELQFSVPGYKKEHFKVNNENKRLTVKAVVEQTETKANYFKREFEAYSFERSFVLPDDVVNEAIEARYENGILNVIIPKKEKQIEEEKFEIAIN